jgi:cysteine-rich repeat protein
MKTCMTRSAVAGLAVLFALSCGGTSKKEGDGDEDTAGDGDATDLVTDTPDDVPDDVPDDTAVDVPDDTPEDVPDDTPADAVDDTPADTADDTPADTAADTVTDTGADTVTDTGVDTVTDTGADTVTDTGVDTVTDTGTDTGTDPGPDTSPGTCGDGTLNTGEACDDGNTVTEPCDTTTVGACLDACDLLMAECGDGAPDPGEACDDGDADSMDACTTSCTVNDNHIGAPCECSGTACDDLDPTAGTITGCSAVAPLADSSRTLACVRSAYDRTYGIEMYFAAGYCTLLAISCSGSILCGLVPTTGDTSTFSCPTGYAVTTETRNPLGSMIVTTMSCLVECTSDSDCRWNEEETSYSPWAGDCGEYRCIPQGDAGELVCTDARNYTP